MNSEIILVCSPLIFYTPNDEDLLFEWIKKVSSIKDVKGVGEELHLTFESKDISNEDLLDLFGIFERYKFDISQLKQFKNESNKHWF